jgi:hypothetical protein
MISFEQQYSFSKNKVMADFKIDQDEIVIYNGCGSIIFAPW